MVSTMTAWAHHLLLRSSSSSRCTNRDRGRNPTSPDVLIHWAGGVVTVEAKFTERLGGVVRPTDLPPDFGRSSWESDWLRPVQGELLLRCDCRGPRGVGPCPIVPAKCGDFTPPPRV